MKILLKVDKHCLVKTIADFNALMQKASDDMIKLTSVIEDAEDIRGTLKQFMWSNCKACHSRYREEH